MQVVSPDPADPVKTAPTEAAHIQDILDEIYEKYRHVDDGAVATYIPEHCCPN